MNRYKLLIIFFSVVPAFTDCKLKDLIKILIMNNQYGWWSDEPTVSFYIINESTSSQYPSAQQ